MSFADTFYVLTWFYVCLTVLVVLVRKPAAGAAAGGGH
jgi:hypothetical protein